ncbi:MAG: FliH/SctL family protein [Lachnospiraceae bacterium]
MSNLLKGFYTKKADDRVIDYNEVISNKIESFRQKMENEAVPADGFVNGLNAEVVEGLIGEEMGSDTGEAEADALDALTADSAGASVGEEELRELAGNIVGDANAKAEEILLKAREEAEEIKKTAYASAYEEGSRKGYEEGSARAEEEYQKLINDANQELSRLEQEYTTRYNNMESELVDTLLQVFAQVTHTVSEDNKEIILHLINQVLSNVECTGDFLIRVSKEDYPFLSENQGKIYLASPKDINLSVLEDSFMEKGQCVIETEGGIFDCSLDIQLEQLIKDIKLLSCMQQ